MSLTTYPHKLDVLGNKKPEELILQDKSSFSQHYNSWRLPRKNPDKYFYIMYIYKYIILQFVIKESVIETDPPKCIMIEQNLP